ncbi:hypothetical protein G6F24_017559 [Rhizopus arrhizus]|nr:hypothetical protein G6F24_017559 [Rhizopus arrhizus]
MTLSQGDSETLVAQLREGAIDAAFVRPPFALDGGLTFTQLAEEPLVVALPLGHALARKKRLAPADLTQERFILYSRKSARPESADRPTRAAAGVGGEPGGGRHGRGGGAGVIAPPAPRRRGLPPFRA